MEENIFEKFRHKGQDGNKYWLARELASAAGYKDYRNFKGVVEKAIGLCRSNFPTQRETYAFSYSSMAIRCGQHRSVSQRLSRWM